MNFSVTVSLLRYTPRIIRNYRKDILVRDMNRVWMKSDYSPSLDFPYPSVKRVDDSMDLIRNNGCTTKTERERCPQKVKKDKTAIRRTFVEPVVQIHIFFTQMHFPYDLSLTVRTRRAESFDAHRRIRKQPDPGKTLHSNRFFTAGSK